MSPWRTPCTIAIVLALLASLIPHATAAQSTSLRLDTKELTRVMLAELAEAVSACLNVPTITACAHVQHHFAEDVRLASFTGVIEYTLVQQLLAFVVSATAGLSAPVIATIVTAIVVAIVVLWCISDTAQCQKTGHTLHKQAMSLIDRTQLGRHAGDIKKRVTNAVTKKWNELYSAFKKDKKVTLLLNKASELINLAFQKLPPSFHKNMHQFCATLPNTIRSGICVDKSEETEKIISYPTKPNREAAVSTFQWSMLSESALKHIPDENCLNLILFGKKEQYTDPHHPQHNNALHMQSINISPYGTLTAAYEWNEPEYKPKKEEIEPLKTIASTVIYVFKITKDVHCTIINDMHTKRRTPLNTINQQPTKVHLQSNEFFLIALYSKIKKTIFHAHLRETARLQAEIRYLRFSKYANMQILPEKKENSIYRYTNRHNHPNNPNTILRNYRYQIPLTR